MKADAIHVSRYCLAAIWGITGLLSLGLYPVEESVALLGSLPVSREHGAWLVYSGGVLDLAMAAATLLWPVRRLWVFQFLIVGSYTLMASVLVPEYWLHPFGPLLKNLAVFAVLWQLLSADAAGKENMTTGTREAE